MNLCPYQDRYCALHRVAEKDGRPVFRADGEFLLTCMMTPDNSICKGKIEHQEKRKGY